MKEKWTEQRRRKHMNKIKRSFLGIGSLSRFKFTNYILTAVVASYYLNIYILILIVKAGKMFFAGEIPYIISQFNFFIITTVLTLSLLYIMHFGLGALFRMENVLDKIINGDRSLRIHLRKRDIMHPFADKLNKVLDLLEKNTINKKSSAN